MDYVKKPVIFEYTNYRVFLADLYEHLKSTTDYFSYRYFAKHAGFRSPNYLKLVIKGERNLSAPSVEQFCQALKLKPKESQFFKLLVDFTQAKNSKEKSQAALKLLQTTIYQKLNPLDQDQLNYYQRWYQIGIRELSLCGHIKNDPQYIAQLFRPHLKVSEAKQAIESLKRLNMIEITKDNQIRAIEQNVTTSGEVVNSMVAIYHKNMLDKAKESIDITASREREISSICVPVSKNTFNEMKNRIQNFKKELIALASQDQDPNQVYQLNLQLFPLTDEVSNDEVS